MLDGVLITTLKAVVQRSLKYGQAYIKANSMKFKLKLNYSFNFLMGLNKNLYFSIETLKMLNIYFCVKYAFNTVFTKLCLPSGQEITVSFFAKLSNCVKLSPCSYHPCFIVRRMPRPGCENKLSLIFVTTYFIIKNTHLINSFFKTNFCQILRKVF